MGRFFSDKVTKCMVYFGLFKSFLHIYLGKKRQNKYYLRDANSVFYMHIDIWFDVTKCKFIIKNSSFKMVAFLPIFEADTKITFVCNFVAPLTIAFLKSLQLSDLTLERFKSN